jgi:outer membrane protein assembly factor BamB
MTNPPTSQRTLAWARPLTRVAAGALLLLGLAGLVAGYLLPWSRFDPGSAHLPPVALRIACGLLGPGLSALAVLRPAVWSRRVAALGALGVAAFGALQLITITPLQGYGAGGALTVLGALALAGGWLLGGPPVRAAELARVQRVPGLIIFVGSVVLVGFAGWGAQYWFTEGRFVDADTAGKAATSSTAAPERLDHQRWQRTLPGEQLVGLVSGRLVVRDKGGVRALDPATGQERWHYQRHDLTTVNAAATGDGATVLLFYGQGRGVLAVALAAGSGQERWTRQLDTSPSAPWNVGTLIPAADAVAAVELGGGQGVRLVGGDHLGGAHPTALPAAGCSVSSVAAAGNTVAVAVRCADGEQVLGVSAGSGRQLWSWRPPYPTGFTGADPLQLTGAGTGLLVEYGERGRATDDGTPVASTVPRAAVLLDPAGRAGPEHRVSGLLLLASGATAVYLDGSAVGIDMGTGTQVFSTPLATVAGYHPVASRSAAGTGYLLFRGPNSSGRINGDGGALAVVALNLGTGQLAASRLLPTDQGGCHPGSDGRTLCGQRPATLAVGAGAVFLAEVREDDLALTALD